MQNGRPGYSTRLTMGGSHPSALIMPQETETLATSTDETGLTYLLQEFRSCGLGSDYWNKQVNADDTRLARWDGQSDDGKKWDNNLPDGQPAFPWNGASDVRCYQADEVINEGVAINTSAFWRADIRVEGVEVDDISGASSATRFMDWMRDSALRKELETEVELSAQYIDWYGWCGLHVTWDRLISYRWRVIDMKEMGAIAEQLKGQAIPDDPNGEIARAISVFPAAVADPEMEDIAVSAISVLYRTYVNAQLPDGVDESEIPDVSAKRAKTLIRELRKLGRSSIPVPYVCRNKPSISALKPWRDIVFPADTTDAQNARAVFIRQFLTEADLRASVLSDGWDQEFVEKAINTKGKLSIWNFQNQSIVNPLVEWTWTQQKNNLIEIIYAYHRAVDDDGISAIYCTTFSAHIQEGKAGESFLVGKSGILDHPNIDEYPIVVGRREILDRQVMSCRGIPEILLTSQREEKVIRDSVMDLISIATIPPINVYKNTMQARYRFAPAAENQVTPGREPKLLDVPEGGGAFAAEYLQALRTGIDHYFGRVREDVPPQLSQMLTEPKVRRFLGTWAEALKMAFCLWQKKDPDAFQRVTGEPGPDDQADKFDFLFHFDVAQLNPDAMEKKLAAFAALRLNDSNGVINQSALIQMEARMIDSRMAKQLVMDPGPASQQLYEKVKADLVGMSDGNQASYTDASKDPTAQARMQYLTQIIGQNMRYMARLDPRILQQIGINPQQLQQMGQGQGQGQPDGQGQGQGQGQSQSQVDPIFSALVEKYVKNVQLGVSQQQNKQIGRIGVNQNQ